MHETLNKALRRMGLQTKGTRFSDRRRIVDADGKVVFVGTARETWKWLRDSGRLPRKREPSPRQKLSQAMRDPDHWVCLIRYEDRTGRLTERKVSPVRYKNNDRTLLTLDLGRMENRLFTVSKIKSVELIPAESVLMGDEEVREIQA